ncbi:PREDICTED: laminin subunit gamma-1-like isoform X2 [Branchiostoma belcheri]|uniref:Laminin subunit gamma-1-like isoform X1 n=1 Tax=Branchiostoma belcheri TaxID=7741 RepID=A0A6P4YK92_BRABE|nr:PREDICTED: laminin subunit gamma-1-like isoform X1 [Branchiostoma belcheri]XP_019619116.1 PREDICTED: laminin subunit gamma-1-like isoform X1 [Branchiostoma belcheri]XP_019619117.1 PREDICTED: laminin subunit gamma-1-like isoform X2 [Branchiostoma belcheri]
MAVCKIFLCALLVALLSKQSCGFYDIDWLWDSIDGVDKADGDTDAKQQECGCDQYGSETWKGCDIFGQCQCLPNVQGTKCDQCIYGYWNIMSGAGCQSCDCDLVGAMDSACDQSTGQCNCKEGFGGTSCDTCAENYYGTTQEGCKACECNSDGSMVQQCNADGTCSCKSDIFGDKCDKCRENYYDVSRGCLQCPACYSDVNDQVTNLRAMVQQLQQLIDDASGGSPITDPTFEARLAQTEQDAADLLEQIRGGGTGTGGAVDELEDLLNDLRAKVSGIQDNVDRGRRDANDAADKVLNIRGIIAQINQLMGDMKDYMENEGKDIIDNSGGDTGSASAEFDELVKKAEELANEQEGDAQKIEDVSNNALSIAKEALKRIKGALDPDGSDSSVGALDDLQAKLDQAAKDLEKVKQEADAALQKAQTTDENAQRILTNALARTSNLDVEGLKTQANNIKTESDDLLGEIDKLDTDGTAVVNDVTTNHDEALKQLQDAKEQIKRTDQLMARAHGAKRSTDEAVDDAEAILADAEKTLETLSDFANKVDEAKSDAKAALTKEPNIRAIIVEAETATTDANTDLGSAKTDAEDAKNTAEDAKRIADDTKTSARQELERADRLAQKAEDRHKEAQTLHTDVENFDNAGRPWDLKKKQADQDEATIAKAKADAERIKKEADDTFNLLEETDRRLQAILDKLGEGSDAPDADTMKSLQQTYDNQKAQWEALNLNQWLVNVRAFMQETTVGLNVDIDALRREVDNLEAIKNALPEGCFRAATGVEGT